MGSNSFQFVMRRGPTPNQAFDLTQPVISIGRDITNDIIISDPEMSRKHARLTSQAGGYIIEDLDSLNGTFIDGKRLVGPHLLRPGELVLFGESITLSFIAPAFDPGATIVSTASLPPFETPASPYDTYMMPAGETFEIPQPTPRQTTPESQTQVYPVQPAYPSQSSSAVPAPSRQAPVSVSGQIPQSPDYVVKEQSEKRSRTWILLGIGCLVMFLCVCIGTAVAFDTLNLYCVPPFNSFFDFIYACP